MTKLWQRLRGSRTALFAIPILAMAGLLWLAIRKHGRPIDGYTWTALAVVLVCSALPGFYRLRWRWAALILLVGVYIVRPGPFLEFRIIPLQRWSLCDDHGGRRGLQISPMLRFGHDGPNTKLLESYLGPLPPNWWQQAPNFPGIRDGNERVQSRNPILRDYLPDILEMLPDDAARKQVLTCLVDTENRLRVHQGLLLACLMELGYPPGLNAETWWEAHRDLFKCEHDPVAAAKLTRGWLRKIERRPIEPSSAMSSLYRAADYQERGSWGGHWDFGEAAMKLEWDHPPEEIDASDKILWWPSASEALFGEGQVTDEHLVRYAPDGSELSRVPQYFVYSEGFVEHLFRRMVLEPNPQDWPAFGKLEYKLDGEAAEVTILNISGKELGLRIDDQVFRGLDKSKFLEIFKEWQPAGTSGDVHGIEE
ncbi:MAG: hypothetical protein DWQ37_20995 [Planctomycetota bacterium]|nr:MAG: hypothetical protein DWQ37_20995 [Planctomycetota bacterium]